MNFINCMNTNQGFIIAILTLVYVGATILIWRSNKKSANAATRQVDEMKNIQQQNVRLQLFEKRYNIYILFSRWFNDVKDVFAANVLVEDVTIDLKKKIFNSKIFGTSERFDEIKCLEEMYEIKGFIDGSKVTEQTGGLTEKEKINMLEERNMKQFRYERLEKQLSSYRKAKSRYYEEFDEIEFCEYFFEDLDFKKLSDFVIAYNNMFMQNTTENLTKLENAFKAINTEETLEKMKKQLIVLEVNK